MRKKLEEKKIDKSNYYILKEKEIESYLLDEEAIAKVLSVDLSVLRNFDKGLKGTGKERLEKIVAYFTGRPPEDQVKGLIARALAKIPDEIMYIVEEIQSSLSTQDVSQFMDEDY